MVLITHQGSQPFWWTEQSIFLQNFHEKIKSPVPSEGLLVLFLSKSVNTMTSAENQLYRFNYCLALMLVTIFFFKLVFTEH